MIFKRIPNELKIINNRFNVFLYQILTINADGIRVRTISKELMYNIEEISNLKLPSNIVK